jgi:predicted nucleic acid-binding protein
MVFHVIVLDTSLLVSFYLTSDSNHDKAITIAEKNSNETLFLSEIILFETRTVLNYRGGMALPKEAYEKLPHNEKSRFFHCTDEEMDAGAIFWLKYKNKVEFC